MSEQAKLPEKEAVGKTKTMIITGAVAGGVILLLIKTYRRRKGKGLSNEKKHMIDMLEEDAGLAMDDTPKILQAAHHIDEAIPGAADIAEKLADDLTDEKAESMMRALYHLLLDIKNRKQK